MTIWREQSLGSSGVGIHSSEALAILRSAIGATAGHLFRAARTTRWLAHLETTRGGLWYRARGQYLRGGDGIIKVNLNRRTVGPFDA